MSLNDCADDCGGEEAEVVSISSDDDSMEVASSRNSSAEEEEEEVMVSLPMSQAEFTNEKKMAFMACIARAAKVETAAVSIARIHPINGGTCLCIEATVMSSSTTSTRLTTAKLNRELLKDGRLPAAIPLDDNQTDVMHLQLGIQPQSPLSTGGAGGVGAGVGQAAVPAAPPAAVLPASVGVSSRQFRRFVLPGSVSSACLPEYQKTLRNYFTGQIPGQEQHNWQEEVAALRQIRRGSPPPPALSVWQAAGYKHAQKILGDKMLKGSLFWWSCGSGKSIMVALLIELLVTQLPGMRVVVVTTPQNVKENSLKECAKSLLRFSPRFAKGSCCSDDISEMLKKLRPSGNCGIRAGDFWSFRQFYSQYQGKDMSKVCLIVDECHELFNEKLKDRENIYGLVSKAHKIVTLSGTPWRNTDQMMLQLQLLHTSESKASLAEHSDLELADKLKRYSAGCVSYVDGTKDRSTHPIDGGWVVQQCAMSIDQLFNFSTRCQNQLSKSQSGIQNPCQLAGLLTAKEKISRDSAYTTCRHTQVAAGEYWGSATSGLRQLLAKNPGLAAVQKLSPKFAKLCEALCNEDLDKKHFVYSAYHNTITHLGITMDFVTSAGRLIFKQLSACDFEWHGGVLRLKCTVVIATHAIGFVILKGSAEEKRKLKTAFGFVTPGKPHTHTHIHTRIYTHTHTHTHIRYAPHTHSQIRYTHTHTHTHIRTAGGERFQGLLRSNSKQPLIQVLLGAREANQGLTFLRLQHIHIMEPNPRGWGQIVQTIGRGIRRGTHEGISDELQRTVRTSIYTTTLDDAWVEREQRSQLHEVTTELTKQHTAYHAEYSKLRRLVGADGVKKSEIKASRKNLKTLAKNIQTLSGDTVKLQEAWLRAPTGKFKQDLSTPKTALVRTWKMLPDEAVFRVTWSEEADRARYDKIIRESAVDFLVLKTFHMTRSVSANKESYTQELSRRFARDRHQQFEAGDAIFVGNIFTISSASKKECNICCDVSPSVKGRQSKHGVECSNNHFVCSACYVACTKLSAKRAHEHYLRRRNSGGINIVACTADNCFALFCQVALIQFPLYWKKLDSQHCDFIENPFMISRLQSLVRQSVRPECAPRTGCNGRDGDGRGTTSATVTRVLRIENGPLWERYWIRKQKMMKDVHKSKSLSAKTMDEFKHIFPNVEANHKINELFLFHGYKYVYTCVCVCVYIPHDQRVLLV